jgi:hypothetical protein
MPQFDQETMVKLVSELRKNVARLQGLSALTEAEFLKDPDKKGIFIRRRRLVFGRSHLESGQEKIQ